MRYFIRCSAILTVVFVLAATLAGCGDSNVETIDRSEVARGQNTPASRPDIDAGATGAMGSVAGISWAIPAGWETGPERAMRAATYRAGEGPVKADCAVFYFGPGQGGGVQDNNDRWIGQFTQADGSDSKNKAKIETQTIADLQGAHSVSYDFVDRWVPDFGKFERVWEDRWIRDEGYTKFITEAVSALAKKSNLSLNDVAKAAYPCLYLGDHVNIGKCC